MTSAARVELGGALRALRDGDFASALSIVQDHSRRAHAAQPRFDVVQWADTLGSGVARRGLDHTLRLFDLLDRGSSEDLPPSRHPTAVFELLGQLL